MNFRILKNEDHYIVQKKWLCFWVTVTYSDSGGFCVFSLSKKHATHFYNLFTAEECIIEYKKYTSMKKKRNSKYNIVKSKVCTKLYNEINKDE